MKKLIPLILISFAPLFSKGQAYTPMNMDTSSFWVHDYYYYTGAGGSGRSASARVISYVEKDTIINAKKYHKIVGYLSKVFQNTVGPWHFNQFPKVNYVREDSVARKIYLLYPGSNIDSAYIDFNLLVNDTVDVYPYPNKPNLGYPVTVVDSIQMKSHYSRLLRTTFWQHKDANNFETNEQIEGVGLKFQFPFHIGGGEWNAPGFTCYCYSKKDTIEYLDSWFSVDSCYKQTEYVAAPSSNKNIELKNVSIVFYKNKLSICNEKEAKLSVRLINLNGKKIFIRENSNEYFEYELTDYPAGIYILSLQSSKGIENRKILIR